MLGRCQLIRELPAVADEHMSRDGQEPHTSRHLAFDTRGFDRYNDDRLTRAEPTAIWRYA